MLRVCVTIIAYIISFLSHSGEMSKAPEREGIKEGTARVEQMAAVDTLPVTREVDKEIAW